MEQTPAMAMVLAKFLGLLLTITGVGAAINSRHMMAVVKDICERPAAQMGAAFLPTLVGSYVVAAHHTWPNDWTMLITIIGLVMLIGGAFRSLFPSIWVGLLRRWANPAILSMGSGILALVGIYLLYQSMML